MELSVFIVKTDANSLQSRKDVIENVKCISCFYVPRDFNIISRENFFKEKHYSIHVAIHDCETASVFLSFFSLMSFMSKSLVLMR